MVAALLVTSVDTVQEDLSSLVGLTGEPEQVKISP